ncbi:MAG: Hpt domain-containing protein, partial [Candidatus Rokuibacteriota bacterium]
LFARLVEGFVDDAARRLAALREAVDRGDAPAVRRLAHALRGSCLNVGASRMAEVAETLERKAAVESLDGGRELVERLAAELRLARSALARALREAET